MIVSVHRLDPSALAPHSTRSDSIRRDEVSESLTVQAAGQEGRAGPRPSGPVPDAPRVDEITVAWCCLPPNRELPAGWTGVLSDPERARADRFLVPRARGEFVVGRLLLRALLGEWLRCKPAAVPIRIDAAGRPGLDIGSIPPDWDFSLTHSEGLVAVAFTRGARVGVDIESLSRLEEAGPEVAASVLSSSEVQELAALDLDARVAALARLWVAKEAVLKAWGTGFGTDPRSVEIERLGHGGLRLSRSPGGALAAWELAEWSPLPGHAGALARCRDLPPG